MRSTEHSPTWRPIFMRRPLPQLPSVFSPTGGIFFVSSITGLHRRGRRNVLDIRCRRNDVWLPRLARRTVRRLRGHEEIWNDNRETLRGAVWGRDALIPYALRAHFRDRRQYKVRLTPYAVVRLRTQAEVERFVSAAGAT